MTRPTSKKREIGMGILCPRVGCYCNACTRADADRNWNRECGIHGIWHRDPVRRDVIPGVGAFVFSPADDREDGLARLWGNARGLEHVPRLFSGDAALRVSPGVWS